MPRVWNSVFPRSMSNGAGEQSVENVPALAENEQVQPVQASSMVTDEEPSTNGAPVRP